MEDAGRREKRGENGHNPLLHIEQSILQNPNVWVMALGPEGNVRLWNTAAERMSGYSADEAIGNPGIWKWLYPDKEYRNHITKTIGRIIEEKDFLQNFETTIHTKAGESKNILWNTRSIIDEKGENTGYTAIGIDITKAIETQRSLAESEERFRQVADSAGEFIWEVDSNGLYTYCSAAVERILGYSSSEMVGKKHYYDLFASDVREELTAAAMAAFQKKEPISDFINPNIHKNGTIVIMETHGAPVLDGKGNLLGYRGTDMDITERRRAEQALLTSEERYREVVEDQTEFICRFTPDGTLTFVNDAYCRYFQLNKNECIGKHHSVVIPPEDARKMRDHIKALTPENPVALIAHRIIMPNGEIRWQRWSDRAIFDKNGHVVEYQTVGRDITVQKQAEKALQDSERRLVDIINFIPDATFAIDLEGKIIAWNRAIEEMTGVAADDMMGKGGHEYSIPFYGEKRPITIDLIFGDTEEIRKMYPVVQKKGDKFTSEIYIQRLYGGKGAHLWFVAAPLYDTKGNITGAIESIRDVSDRKRAEEALIKFNEELEQRVKERTEQINASLEEKIVLLREVHHRVKNNLQIIISLLKLQSRYMTDENTIAAFRECQNRVMAMSLVHEKLYQSADISKIDLGNYVRFLGNSLFQFFGMKGTGVTFTTDIQDISLDINTAIPVGLIINELVSNSLKYAFPQKRTGEISVAIRRENHTLSILFADNGVGIPADFDWRNAKSLGLRLVTSLVEQLQGTIELDRSAGTAFTIVVMEED